MVVSGGQPSPVSSVAALGQLVTGVQAAIVCGHLTRGCLYTRPAWDIWAKGRIGCIWRITLTLTGR